MHHINQPTKMKIMKSLFAFAAIFSVNSGNTQTIIDAWPDLKNYHDIITKSYKSAKKGDLSFIKKHADSLSENAEKIAVENMPQCFRFPKTIEALVTLKRESKTIQKLVEKKSHDQEIFETLKSAHETFKNMIGICTKKK